MAHFFRSFLSSGERRNRNGLRLPPVIRIRRNGPKSIRQNFRNCYGFVPIDSPMQPITGLHHITAIAGPAQENLDFYAGVLGMRLVKKASTRTILAPITCSMPMRKAIPERTNIFPLGRLAPSPPDMG